MTDSLMNLGTIFENATKNLSTTMNDAFSSTNVNLNQLNLHPAINKLLNTNYHSSQNMEFTSKQIVDGLNSSNDKEILVILKYLVKLMSTQDNKDNDIIQVFPHVIKNITSKNIKIKRLVYIILLSFNHLQQDISLLSINAIQKSLTDKNCINRALSIRCLSGIKIPAILPILLLSLKKTVKDSSPLVRSASAVAIIKCFQLDRDYSRNKQLSNELKDESSVPYQLYNFVDILLSDNDPKVLSSAIVCYNTIYRGYFDLIHPKFNHLLTKLPDLDEYSKCLLIDLLTDYSIMYLPQPSMNSICEELQLFEQSLQKLIYTPSANVCLSLSRCLINLFPFNITNFQLDYLFIKFIGSEQENTVQLMMNQILYMLNNNLIKFKNSQITTFIPLSRDSVKLSKLKISILIKLINESTFDTIFKELKFLIESSNIHRVCKILILKQLNNISSSITNVEQLSKIIRFYLLKLNLERNELLIAEYITGLRFLIQTNLSANIDILIKLTGKLINENLSPVAKSSIIWLLGEFSNSQFSDEKSIILNDSLPDILRIVISNFKNEEYLVKLEILTTITKITSNQIYSKKKQGESYDLDNYIWKLFNLVLQYTKYDLNIDLRDRSRLIGSILPNLIYLDASLTATTIIDFSSYFNDNGNGNFYIEQCYSKLKEIELSVLLFQLVKPSPLSNIDLGLITSSDYSTILQFNKVTSIKLDLELLPYYQELRNQPFELKDYSKYTKSISSKTMDFTNTKSQSSILGNSRTANNSRVSSYGDNNVKKYKLQTLDDFLSHGSNSANLFGSDNIKKIIPESDESESEESEDSEEIEPSEESEAVEKDTVDEVDEDEDKEGYEEYSDEDEEYSDNKRLL
ncbi:hypothetical protein CANARDRAFT_8023 [[Candida] arabinofermentans NRRL YB-2248]|uniref:Clathrin/coatomer adaptor adaptin-like N-terminal domain-containing protein n=1 Tax=[Candida] arabinofermentans NRRL YB-2248 TaxID=983967 RepID=A0A1E4SZF1_9ASCO|nr:hypothetical protein CANARDRAFT_8023 [[Candida] arabinofermentans NRRL YB-2248]